MQLLALIAIMTLLAGPADARIYGLTAPTTAPAGGSILVSLNTVGSPTAYYDFGVEWGFIGPGSGCSTTTPCVGRFAQYDNLFGNPAYPSGGGTIPLSVSVPGIFQKGDKVTLVAAVPYVVGAAGTGGTNYFRKEITLS